MRRIIVIILLILLILWLLPIKKTLSEKNFEKKYMVDETVAVLCVSENATDIQFRVLDSTGIEECPGYIKSLKGNTPENVLRHQIDDCYDEVQFLFIGHFDTEITDLRESYDFTVDEWYTVGKVRRSFNILPYPSYGFNIFEIKCQIKNRWISH